MSDRVTKTEEVGVFSALTQSIKNVAGGAGMFLIAFPMMFWNECSSVSTAKSLEEGLGAVVSVSADTVDAANEGKLVHISGDATTTETLSDNDFGVSVQAIKLSRDVEMYQWKERSSTKTEGNKKTTTYDYQTAWAGELLDSDRFEEPVGHRNPSSMPYSDKAVNAQTVTVGAFTLSGDQVANLSASEAFVPENSSYTVNDGYIYLGSDPSDPVVGDMRIKYTVLRPGPMSVVAQQSGSSFVAYQASAGKPVSLIETGTRSADEMFATAQASNTMLTWVMRFVAFLFVFVGMNLVLGPLRVVADRVPFIGRIFSAGMTLVTFCLAVALTFMTISIAWIAARPLIGILLLLVGGGAFVGAAVLIMGAAKAASAKAAA